MEFGFLYTFLCPFPFKFFLNYETLSLNIRHEINRNQKNEKKYSAYIYVYLYYFDFYWNILLLLDIIIFIKGNYSVRPV